MGQTYFSIIVPTYNRAHLLGNTLNSLININYERYEIIVVDDGSTDNTEEIVKPYINERLSYYKKENGERAVARNFGARKAKGDYVNFFDSDDIALKNHLNLANALILDKHKPAWLHLAYAWANPDHSIRYKVNYYKGKTLNHIMHLGNPLSCNGVFIRKDIFLDNLFNETRALSGSEDYELWIRMTAKYPLYYSNEISSLIIDHEQRSVRTMNKERLILRLKLFDEFISQDEQVKAYFKLKVNTILMCSDLYIATHLAPFVKTKIIAIQYLIKALNHNLKALATKTFIASIKNILLKW